MKDINCITPIATVGIKLGLWQVEFFGGPKNRKGAFQMIGFYCSESFGGDM